MDITFTTGLMGAGKSKELINQFRKDQTRCIALAANLSKETGTLGSIESRNGQSIFAINLNNSQIEEVIKYIKGMFSVPGLETVYFDEIQFLPKYVIELIVELSKKYDVTVHFFGLSTTFTTDPFESSKHLIETLPDKNLIYIERDCEKCTSKIATYNARIEDGKVAREGETFVSSKSTYLALCKKCYFE